jgi:hypothetical protein
MLRSNDAMTPIPVRSAGDKVGVRQVEPVDLVDLDGPLERVGVEHTNGGERQDRPKRRRNLRPGRLVERLEDVGDLGDTGALALPQTW